MATIKDIAEKCGVSTSTVSRALKNSDKISAETIEKVRIAAEELGFTPRNYKSSRQSSKSGPNTIALLINIKNQPVSSIIVRSVNKTLASYGYDLVVFDTADDANQELHILDKIKNVVNGIIIEPASDIDSYNIEFLQEINKKIPVVTIIRTNRIPGISCITSNSSQIYSHGVQLLIENGHKEIGILISKLSHKTSFEKLNAYNETLKANNIPVKSEYIVYTKFDETETKEKVKELLKKHPEITALATSNAGISRGTLLAIGELGLKVPDDISIMAYGNDMLFSYPGINITSIEDNHEEMGNYAANIMINKIESYRYDKKKDPTRIEIIPTLYIRGSEVFPKNRRSPKNRKNKK